MCDIAKPPRAARARKPGRLARLAAALRAGASRLRRVVVRGHRPAIEVLVAESGRRRSIERELRSHLRRLRRALGCDLPVDAIVVQQVLRNDGADKDRAGSTRVATRADGRRRTIMVLALQCDGRRLSIDEVLAALAMQAVTLVGQGGTVELATVSPSQLAAAPKGADPAQGAPSPSQRRTEGRRAMLELIHGTAPLAPTPHVNGQGAAPYPGA